MLSAREKVLRVRWAQHQASQLHRRMIQNFPQIHDDEQLGGSRIERISFPDDSNSSMNLDEPPDAFNETLARKNFQVSIPPSGPSRALSVPNSLIPTRSRSSRSFVGPLAGDDIEIPRMQAEPLPHVRPSEDQTNHNTNAKKPLKKKPKKSSLKKVSASVSRKRTSDTVIAENGNETPKPSRKASKSPLLTTKNSLETLKSRKASSSALASSKSKIKPESSQGRMFRHRYSFQDSIEPSPNASRTSSNIPMSKKLGPIGIPPSSKRLPFAGNPRITSPTGSEIITPTRSAEDFNSNNYNHNNEEEEEGAVSVSSKKQIIFGGASRENLCIPSLLFTKKSISEKNLNSKKTWVEKRFPKLADEVESWHKRFPFMKHGIEVKDDTASESLKFKKYKATRTPIEHYNESYQQPPPHKRGLIGVEISSFDADCAVFYQGQNGIYNPHLYVTPTEKDLHPSGGGGGGVVNTKSARKFLWSPSSSKSLQRIRFKDGPHYKSKSKSDNDLF